MGLSSALTIFDASSGQVSTIEQGHVWKAEPTILPGYCDGMKLCIQQEGKCSLLPLIDSLHCLPCLHFQIARYYDKYTAEIRTGFKHGCIHANTTTG